MDRVIYHSTSLKCDSEKAFEMFSVNENLEKWLTRVADVEPKIGGKYELFWNPEDRENDSTIGCKILALKPNKFLSFEWKGPKQFKHFMNNSRPLTNVVIFFIPQPKGTEVHLLHTGWRYSAEWEEARNWFDKAWATALSKLQNYVSQECARASSVGVDMEQNLEIGLTLTESYTIRDEHAAKSVGSGEVEVLSTPAMIAFMEKTSRRSVESKLPEDFITVGTKIDMRHLSPVPIGEKLKVEAQLLKIDNRRLVFRVEAEWRNKVIGRGEHERYIINKERFLKRVKQETGVRHES